MATKAEPADDRAAIALVFADIRSSVERGDYAPVADRLNERTLNHYERLRQIALHGSAAQVRATPLLDRVIVLRLRHELGAGRLETMSAADLLGQGMDVPFIGFEAITSVEPGPIVVNGATAEMRLAFRGSPTQRSYAFSNAHGAWKLDLLSVFAEGERVFLEMLRRSGKSDDAFVLDLLEQASGRPVPATIWSATASKAPAAN